MTEESQTEEIKSSEETPTEVAPSEPVVLEPAAIPSTEQPPIQIQEEKKPETAVETPAAPLAPKVPSEPETKSEATIEVKEVIPPVPEVGVPSAPNPIPPQPQSQAPIPPEPLKSLLQKAREKIQFRKRKKLEKILKFAREKGRITNDEAQKLLRISDATATRYLSQLVKEGKLRRSGPAKNEFYEPLR